MIDIANILFCLRNGKRTQNGEGGRSLVTVAQGAKFFKQVKDYDNVFGDMTKNAIDAFAKISENDKAFKYLSKGVKFASNNVNTLICVSSGINVINSKDKQSAIISEGGNLAGMFLIEGWMKKNLDGIIEKLPINKKWKPIVRGIVFVIGSIGVSNIGYKLGKIAAEKLKEENEKAKIQMAKQKSNNKINFQKLAYSA